jgi:hypothetical protein
MPCRDSARGKHHSKGSVQAVRMSSPRCVGLTPPIGGGLNSVPNLAEMPSPFATVCHSMRIVRALARGRVRRPRRSAPASSVVWQRLDGGSRFGDLGGELVDPAGWDVARLEEVY